MAANDATPIATPVMTPVASRSVSPTRTWAPVKASADSIIASRVFQLEEARRQIATTKSAITDIIDNTATTADAKLPMIRSALENLTRPTSLIQAVIGAVRPTAVAGGARRSKSQRRRKTAKLHKARRRRVH
jgi:hypothetical protein